MISEFLSKQNLSNLSNILINLDNEFVEEYMNFLLKKKEIDISRCGIISEIFLNNVYFSSKDDLQNNIIMHNLNIELLKNRSKVKNFICKISWSIWEKDKFEFSKKSGIFEIPSFEHTYLIDLPIIGFSKHMDAYIIQSAFEIYDCQIHKINQEFLWDHLNFLSKFDRTTILDGNLVSKWIQNSLFINQENIKSFSDTLFIGQIISFTCYCYDSESGIRRLNNIIT